jgi:hypothetical protein
MRSEQDIKERIYMLSRIIDRHSKDTNYDVARFNELLWVLSLGESFRDNLLPERQIKSATGRVLSFKNYSKTLSIVFGKVKK